MRPTLFRCLPLCGKPLGRGAEISAIGTIRRKAARRVGIMRGSLEGVSTSIAWCALWPGPGTGAVGGPACMGGGRGATPRVLRRQLPPPPPLGASGQQLVAKGAALRSPWAPKASDALLAPKAPEGEFCPPTLSLNPTLTLTPTPTLGLVLTLHLHLHLHLPLPLTLTLTLSNSSPALALTLALTLALALDPMPGSEFVLGSKMEQCCAKNSHERTLRPLVEADHTIPGSVGP